MGQSKAIGSIRFSFLALFWFARMLNFLGRLHKSLCSLSPSQWIAQLVEDVRYPVTWGLQSSSRNTESWKMAIYKQLAMSKTSFLASSVWWVRLMHQHLQSTLQICPLSHQQLQSWPVTSGMTSSLGWTWQSMKGRRTLTQSYIFVGMDVWQGEGTVIFSWHEGVETKEKGADDHSPLKASV